MPNTFSASRRAFARPQAIIFSDQKWTFDGNVYIPPSDNYQEGTNYRVLSDHNRQAISLNSTRIETRERMIDGSMRSYWVADKTTLSTSWNLLPSRALPVIDSSIFFQDEQTDTYEINFKKALTVDAGAGGNELLEWYRRHQGSFYVLLSYDRYSASTVIATAEDSGSHQKLYGTVDYQEQYEMFFSSFEHSVEKRNQQGSVIIELNNEEVEINVMYDLWNVSLALEEA